MEMDSRNEILLRYRHLRAISIDHHTEAIGVLPGPALVAQAKRLGLTYGKTIVADEDEFPFICDLALYTATPGRSRAIDRYARAQHGKAGSDKDQMLSAMQAARFSIWQVEDRPERGGVIVRDMVREEGNIWLMDESMALSAPIGLCFGARLFRGPDGFSMTCGIVVAIDRGLMEALSEACGCILDKRPHEVTEDRRFATALYRLKIADDGFLDAEQQAA